MRWFTYRNVLATPMAHASTGWFRSSRARAIGGIAAVLALTLMATSQRRSPAQRHAVEGVGTARAPFTLDSAAPPGRATLLFLDGRPTLPLSDGRRVATTEDGVLRIADDRLRLSVVPLPQLHITPVGAAPAGDDTWWITSRDGSLHRVDASGRSRDSAAAPFAATTLWPLRDGGVLAARSPERFSFDPEPTVAPLLVVRDVRGQTTAVGAAQRPTHELLTSVANAGYAVARADTAFFAPLGRSELVAIRFDGREIWRHVDAQSLETPEPRFEVANGEVRVEYQPFNLGLTLGPDGLLYRLRTLDTALTAVALDIVEPATGAVRATRPLGGPRVTLALDDAGQLHLMDIARLLDAAVPADREALPSFALPMRHGNAPATLAGYRGKVLLLNFWASWCVPCRTEMPALDSLQRELSTDDRFALLAINADVDRAQADAFLVRQKLHLPVAYGGAAMQARYRYPGLPYTVLVDTEGRVIRRWIGQLQDADLMTIRTLVRTEHLRPTATALPGDPARHAHHASARTP